MMTTSKDPKAAHPHPSGLSTSPPKYCAHYVARKKRQCKLTPLKESTYCAEHVVHHTSSTQSDQIPCPLDPAHFIKKTKLEAHLKVCNAKKYDHSSQPYYKENINVISPHHITGLKRIPLSKMPMPELISICKQLINYGANSKICCTRIAAKVSEADLDQYRPLFQKGDIAGSAALKHATQQVALVKTLGHFLRDASLNDTCFVELGAGSGKMSQWFHHKHSDNFYVLVDRQMCRKKTDGYFKKQKTNFLRLKMDIKDIDVSGVADVAQYKKVCFPCKHLCGGATDLALVAANHSAAIRDTTLLIALCCHHLCSWELYTGKEHFLKHFKPEQFFVLSSLSAWATCFKLKDLQIHDPDILDDCVRQFENDPESFIHGDNLVLDKNLQWFIGRCAKNVLNDGRASFMVDNGFRVDFCEYVDGSVSPENIALLCFKSAP